MNPQEALDAPRFCIVPSHSEHGTQETVVAIEEGITMETISRLKALGHRIEGHNRVLFGRGQIICARSGGQSGERVWWAGSDARADGLAVGY